MKAKKTWMSAYWRGREEGFRIGYQSAIVNGRKFRKQLINDLRSAFAAYRRSEGCSCCRDVENHKKHTERIAKLLGVPMYADGSGYDFGKFLKDETAA